MPNHSDLGSAMILGDSLKLKKCCQLLIAATNLMSSQPVTLGIVRPSKGLQKIIAKAREDATQVKTFDAHLRWALFRKGLQLSPGI